MRHPCGACDESGKCQNDHHNLISGMAAAGSLGVLDNACPACGEGHATPGKCSVCGGSGWQDD